MDVPIRLNQLGQQDSLGKSTGKIKQEGLARPFPPTSPTMWDSVKRSHHCGHALIHQHSYGSQPLGKVVTHLSNLCFVLWCYKCAVQRGPKNGECGHQGEHEVFTEGRGQDGIGSLKANCYYLLVGFFRWRELHGCVRLDTHPHRCCSHSRPPFTLPLPIVLPDLWNGVLANSHDDSKADCFGLFCISHIQSISR